MNDYHQGPAVYHEIFCQFPLHRTKKLLQMTMMSYQIEMMSFLAHVWKMFVVLEHVSYVSVDALVPFLCTISSDPLARLNWTPPITPQYCPLLLFWKCSELLPHLEESRIFTHWVEKQKKTSSSFREAKKLSQLRINLSRWIWEQRLIVKHQVG